ncbi:MAG: nucleotidyl transferase AbiEii/AbiGii toxin family protein [Deltaproteobacteria bacterium]|nr:nucleotidyl transferase AbiEii/AbiGii toxin family protein [Deltaproteobacteria bacterium]
MIPGDEPDLRQALRPVPAYERPVREVSKMLSDAGIRHALVGALGANAYRDRPRTTEDIDFLVGDEAFERHPGGFVTMRVPVIEFDGIDVDQVPLTEGLRVIEEGLARAHVSEGVPIAPVDTIVIMKLLAGRTQDLADIEAILASGADRDLLRSAVRKAAPKRLSTLEKLIENADRAR